MNNISFSYFTNLFYPVHSVEETADPTSALVQEVIQKKEANVEKALSNNWRRYNPISGSDTILISGDLFNMGFLVLEGVKSASPHLASLTAVKVASAVCGVFGGVISLSTGLVSFKEGIQALQNGDNHLATRLLFEGVMDTVVGVAMILLSLSAYVVGLGGVGAFFAANPWVLPIVFLLACLPLTAEIGARCKKIYSKEDAASLLPLKDLKGHLEKEKVDWKEVYALFDGTLLDLNQVSRTSLKDLSDKLEEMQTEIGVQASLGAFKLLNALLDKNKEKSLEALKALDDQVQGWNQTQGRRLLQQAPFFLSSLLSLILLQPLTYRQSIEAAQNFSLALASIAPLHMDMNQPFERDTPIVPAKAE